MPLSNKKIKKSNLAVATNNINQDAKAIKNQLYFYLVTDQNDTTKIEKLPSHLFERYTTFGKKIDHVIEVFNSIDKEINALINALNAHINEKRKKIYQRNTNRRNC